MGFPEQLRKARIAAGLTQQQVADAIGITNSTYCGYETGKRQPDVPKIKQLSKILGISGDFLLETGYEKSPTSKGGRTVNDDDIKFALFGGDRDITDAMLEEVRQYAEFVKIREDRKKKAQQ